MISDCLGTLSSSRSVPVARYVVMVALAWFRQAVCTLWLSKAAALAVQPTASGFRTISTNTHTGLVFT
jgi:hypothetical protein